MSQGRVNAWIDKRSEVLTMALGHAHCFPERDLQNLEQMLAMGVSVDFIIDGTERRRQRPTDPVQQHGLSSGKKTHTVKNTLMVDGDDRRVQSLSGTYGGRVHNTRMCDEEDSQFPPCGLFQDTGFQGDKPDHVATSQPKKKPQGKERTDEEKAENTMRASMRMLVEHVIAGVKRCRIVQEVFRKTTTHFADQVMEIAWGLHNCRATWR